MSTDERRPLPAAAEAAARWPEVAALSGMEFRVWSMLWQHAGAWVDVRELCAEVWNDAEANSYAQTVSRVRKKLEGTRWSLETRRSNSSQYRKTSRMWRPAAYRLMDALQVQTISVPQGAHCAECGLLGSVALRAEQDAALAYRVIRHPGCEHVMAYDTRRLLRQAEQVHSEGQGVRNS